MSNDVEKVVIVGSGPAGWTAALYAAATELGARYRGDENLDPGARALADSMERFGWEMGLAFQITDDLLDVEGTREETGKEVGKDATAGKATLVEVLGVDQARMHAQTLAEQAKAHLRHFDKKAKNLQTLADFVVSRRS